MKKFIILAYDGRFWTTRIDGLSKSIKKYKNFQEANNEARLMAKKLRWKIKKI